MTFWRQVSSPDRFRALFGDVAADTLVGAKSAHLYRVETADLGVPYFGDMPEDRPEGLTFCIVQNETSVSGWGGPGFRPTVARRARLAVPLDDPRVLHVMPVFTRASDGNLQVLDAAKGAFQQLNPKCFWEANARVRWSPAHVATRLREEYPNVDWGQYGNWAQLLQAGGSVEARRRGYKAILGAPMTTGALAEAVLVTLTNDSIVWTAPAPGLVAGPSAYGHGVNIIGLAAAADKACGTHADHP